MSARQCGKIAVTWSRHCCYLCWWLCFHREPYTFCSGHFFCSLNIQILFFSNHPRVGLIQGRKWIFTGDGRSYVTKPWKIQSKQKLVYLIFLTFFCEIRSRSACARTTRFVVLQFFPQLGQAFVILQHGLPILLARSYFIFQYLLADSVANREPKSKTFPEN